MTLNISLGHDEHAHELAEKTGCEGTFETLSASGHGAEANVFPVIEAVYTDKGSGQAGALTGRDQAILQPDPKQAEHYSSTGRVPGGGTDGDPGVQTETTSDPQGGGQNIGFIEDGDYVSFEPFNLEGIRAITFRVASGGAGGTIQLRLDAPDGPLVAETATIAPTGGWQNWIDVNLDLPNPPEGTHELFVIFRGGGGGLMNLNFMRFLGKGAAISEAPIVTASAEPVTGIAPLAVDFDGEATDPDAAAGDVLTYKWDFGVAGTTTDTSTELDPTYTYENAGTYRATLTVTDATGQKGTATVEVKRHLVRPVPDRDALGRVRGQRARHQPLDGHTQPRRLRGRQRQPDGAGRQRLDLRPRHERGEHHRPGHARGRLGGDEQDHHRAADRELPAGRPARVLRRRQLGVRAHDLRGRPA